MTSKTHWSLSDAPSQAGRVALVTGANIGLGFETAMALAGKGATVVMACRSPGKAQTALEQIRAVYAGADVRALALDLASLASVEAFASEFSATFDRLDLLINNAGIMLTPFEKTVDGFESQLGVNHLGHFALTGRLLPLLLSTPGARVVALSSNAHKGGRIALDDLNSEKSYGALRAYNQSKLACLMFAYELQRRLSAVGSDVKAVAAHPGASATNLFKHVPKVFQWLTPHLAQSAAMGALPTLYAALGEDIEGGDYTGPSGLGQIKGPPKKVTSTAASHDAAVAKALWEASERLTGVSFDFGAASKAA